MKADFRVPPPAPQFRVVMQGPRRGMVFFKGEVIANVRMVDVAVTATINDVVRSRISIELVGEVIPVSQEEADAPPA